MAGKRGMNVPLPEEELGSTHECRGWQYCALCRSTRLGEETLRRARERRVVWRESNTPLHNPIREPVPYTTLDDAFDSLLHLMTVTSRKCRNYHCCRESPSSDCLSNKHRVRYHSTNTGPDHSTSSLSPPARVMVNTLPGNYTVTAARWGSHDTTTRVVTLDPNKSVTVTMTV